MEGLHSSLLEDEIQDLRKQNELLMSEKLASMSLYFSLSIYHFFSFLGFVCDAHCGCFCTVNAHLTKTLVLREKLESLCRELQRQNKQLSVMNLESYIEKIVFISSMYMVIFDKHASSG